MTTTHKKILTAMLDIETRLHAQLQTILHHADFLALEANWRSLRNLVEYKTKLKNKHIHIKIFNASFKRLAKDFAHSGDFTQSALYQQLYHSELKHPGGHPFGVLITDYQLNLNIKETQFDHVGALQDLAVIAAASFCPVIVNASPALFELDTFSDHVTHFDVTALFQQLKYQRWNAFRQFPETQFMGVTAARIAVRKPYVEHEIPGLGFFTETMNTAKDVCWGAASYAYAKILMRAFHERGWFTGIQGVDSGGDKAGSLKHWIDDGFEKFTVSREAIEVQWTPDNIAQLQTNGFLPLVSHRFTNHYSFYGAHSLSAKKTSLSLSETLCAARFIHYLHAIGRLKIGSFITPQELESYLQRWLLQYSATPNEALKEMDHRYPLRAAQVTVSADPLHWDACFCQVQLMLQQPYQSLNTHIQWVISL